MALYPGTFETKFKLQPGARGEEFTADLPGYRDGATRINRTQNNFNVTPHDTLSQKYLFDGRLRPLFKYGYAIGYNNMVITKGRLVAADPYMDMTDWRSKKQFNTLTLANGGAAVRIRKDTDVYPAKDTIISADKLSNKVNEVGLEWAPVEGVDNAWADGVYRACKKAGAAQLKDAGMAVDPKTGKILEGVTVDKDGNVTNGGTVTDDVRAANVPLGVLAKNEYTKCNHDSFDGYQPGPILTDKIVELPYFAFKDKAEQNPWGSIYGTLKVGDLVKSDENGRFVVSPLSSDEVLDTMTSAEIERERQQVVGQVIGFNHDMVPEGGYELAQWALEDRLRYEGFSPELYTQNNRPGEDAINASVYQSTGKFPGYPYDQAYTEHDLHMLGGGQREGNYDKFMQAEYQMGNGIPALTDGYNAVIKEYQNTHAAVIRGRGTETTPYVRNIVRVCQNGNFEEGTLEVQLTKADGTELVPYTSVTAADDVMKKAKALGDTFKVTFYNAVQGILCIEVADEAKADTLLKDTNVVVNLKYKKRGQAGVPTMLDWDGCVGSAKILLQR